MVCPYLLTVATVAVVGCKPCWCFWLQEGFRISVPERRHNMSSQARETMISLGDHHPTASEH